MAVHSKDDARIYVLEFLGMVVFAFDLRVVEEETKLLNPRDYWVLLRGDNQPYTGSIHVGGERKPDQRP